MKRLSALLVLLVFALSLSAAAIADEMKAVAVITSIELSADGKSAVVKLTNVKTEEPIEVYVTDDLTLDKFKDHRIVNGDEIRLKYSPADGKNLSTYFRKTAGC